MRGSKIYCLYSIVLENVYFAEFKLQGHIQRVNDLHNILNFDAPRCRKMHFPVFNNNMLLLQIHAKFNGFRLTEANL